MTWLITKPTTMKWVTMAFVILSGLFALDATCQQSGPWAFDNLTILTLPRHGVEVRRSEDGRGIELRFSHWNQEMEASIRRMLSGSPLVCRLVPSRQTSMAVEIYSPFGEIDFTMGRHRKKTQVLVGELMPGRAAAGLLMEGESITPLPEGVVELLRAGKMVEARKELSESKVARGEAGFLKAARLAVLDVFADGYQQSRCPDVPRRIHSLAGQEGALLVAWCRFVKGENVEALESLRPPEASEPPTSLWERSNDLRRQIICGQVLSAEREGLPVQVALQLAAHHDLILEDPSMVTTYEVTVKSLIRGGFGHLLSKNTQSVVASADEERLTMLAPAIAESYLAAGQRVRASSVASYFLARAQPAWQEGRLRRVRGHSFLQEGNWKDAMSDLTRSRQLLIDWSLEDDLALAEAALRSKDRGMDVSRMLNAALGGHAGGLSESIREWFDRLFGQAQLEAKRVPDDENLTKLPAHVLYFAAVEADDRGDSKGRARLMGGAAKGRGGWGSLARQAREIDDLISDFGFFKNAMEAMR